MVLVHVRLTDVYILKAINGALDIDGVQSIESILDDDGALDTDVNFRH